LGLGLLFGYGAGFLGLVQGKAFMTGLWWEPYVPLLGKLKLGSTLIFDIGVMLVVIGTVLLMVFSVEDRLPGLIER
jgi:multicomponent Na+:H+ antiporter subunit B